MAETCAGCMQTVDKRQNLTCCQCKCKYDLMCANVPEKRFYNTMTPERKRKWVCDACRCKLPKTNNIDVPASPQHRDLLHLRKVTSKTSTTDPNVTLRKPPRPLEVDGDDSSLDEILNNDESFPGDTPNSRKSIEGAITLDQISQLLDQKLKTSEKNLLAVFKTELRSLIQEEIQLAMTNLDSEINHRFNIIADEQSRFQKELADLNKKIATLEKEHSELTNTIKHLENKSVNLGKTIPTEESSRKLVLYGVEEHKWENENELHDRVAIIFHDLLNINIEGYIEGLRRLGKKGHRRPIMIELINKKVTRHILQNKRFLARTGIAVDEYMTGETLDKRRELRKALFEARKKGHHAVVRNNQLIIDGKPSPQPRQQDNSLTHQENSANTKNSNINCHSFRTL